MLYMRFPDIFKGRSKPLTESLMGFGIECGDGWYDLIWELCEAIEWQAIMEDVPLPEAIQVKEKFGGLRFYVTGATHAMRKLIDEAENRSESICGVCGGQAEWVDTEGWIKTRCKQHLDS